MKSEFRFNTFNLLFSLSTLLLSVVFVAPETAFATPVESDRLKPEIKPLGGQRFQIGSIVVDKEKQRFSVPGVVLRLKPPLEYLAVTKGGDKGYESLLELETNAFEFNLACILIGFDADQAKLSHYHFDPEPVEGQAVKITVSWKHDEEIVEVSGTEMLVDQGKTVSSDDWVYTGSMIMPDGVYMADSLGTLIGFVHDPASVIEHRTGLGVGNYGAIGGNTALVPKPGSPITVVIEHVLK